MMPIIKVMILRQILELTKEQKRILLKTNDVPRETITHEWLMLTYAILDLKISFWRAIL